MRRRGKKYKAAVEKISDKAYVLSEALKLLKELAYVGFDESVDMVFHLNVDPKHADQMVRGSVILPKGTGKKVRILVIAQGERVKEAEDAGADMAGGDEWLKKIKEGWMEFDAMVATPDMMREVGKLGKILGPRGLMPSPKTGTVTFHVRQAVQDLKAGKVDYRVDKTGNVHAIAGKMSFSVEDLAANATALITAVVQDRPAAVKGHYIKSFHMSSTMGPSISVDTTSYA